MIRATVRCRKIISTGSTVQALLCGIGTENNSADNNHVNLATNPVLAERLNVDITCDHPENKNFLQPGKLYFVEFTEVPDKTTANQPTAP